jgi:hypothetical protein
MDNPIGDEGLEHLKKLPKLAEIGLIRTGVSLQTLKDLKLARPGMHISTDLGFLVPELP